VAVYNLLDHNRDTGWPPVLR